MMNMFGNNRRYEGIFLSIEDGNKEISMDLWGINKIVAERVVAKIIFLISRCWFGWMTTKYENITSIPPI